MSPRVLTVFVALLLLSACRKDEETVSESHERDLYLHMAYRAGTVPLQFDTLVFENAAGNRYSVSRLEYFISGIVLRSPDGDFTDNKVHYLNVRDAKYAVIGPVRVPERSFSGISFFIGVDSIRNIPDGLPATMENNGMFWPVSMGGGYHFLKLEGHFTDTAGTSGYAIHLGKNKNLVRVNIPLSAGPQKGTLRIGCMMDVNEWFDHPHRFDLITDGKYTMSSDLLMKKIAENGSDVFTAEWLP